MNNSAFSYLNFIHFSQLNKWYVSCYINPHIIKSKYKLVSLEKLMKPYKKLIKKNDYKGDVPIIEKISFKDGKIHYRKEFKTGMNLYELKPKQLLVSKINFHQGALSIADGIITNCSTHYQPYEVDYSSVLSDYLVFVIRSNKFQQYLSYLRADGIKNEATYDFIKTLKIPLPTLEKQKEIVDRYNEKIKLAEEQEKEAQNLEQEIDNYFLEKLGIKQIQKNLKCTKNKYLTFINFKNLKRWDALAQNFYIYDLLKTSQYKLCKLGNVYNFINRSWIKKGLSKNQEYKYVEIGSVDLIKGIIETKKITINNAPSRATQIIKNGDLIIGTTRPYLKKFAIVDEKHDNCICSSGFQVIEPSKSYNLLFLKEFLSSDIGIEQLKNKMTGALYPAITFEELKNILIPLPSLEIQNEVITTITKTKLQIKNLKETSEQNRQLAQEEFEKELFE